MGNDLVTIEDIMPELCEQMTDKEICKRVAELRISGLDFPHIAQKLRIDVKKATSIYNDWTKGRFNDWKEERKETLVRFNEAYSNRLREAEKNYQLCKDEGLSDEMGKWSKHIVEITEKYENFLKSCGYLSDDMAKEKPAEKTKEPMEIVIDEYKKYLMDKIRDEGETKK